MAEVQAATDPMERNIAWAAYALPMYRYMSGLRRNIETAAAEPVFEPELLCAALREWDFVPVLLKTAEIVSIEEVRPHPFRFRRAIIRVSSGETYEVGGGRRSLKRLLKLAGEILSSRPEEEPTAQVKPPAAPVGIWPIDAVDPLQRPQRGEEIEELVESYTHTRRIGAAIGIIVGIVTLIVLCAR